MGKPDKNVIKLCEDLLGRARSGKLEGLMVAELRQGERINASIRSMSPDEAFKSIALLGHISAKAFLKLDDEGQEAEHVCELNRAFDDTCTVCGKKIH